MTDRPARSADIDISPVADGCIVYDPGTDLVHHLNHTAAMVLELCSGQETVSEIAAFLTELFPSAPDVLAVVTDCVDQLRSLGLVRPAAEEAAQASRAGSASQPRTAS